MANLEALAMLERTREACGRTRTHDGDSMEQNSQPPDAVVPSASRDADRDCRFAIVTPSYYVDYECCRWLCETVERYVPSYIPHYLIVDRADRSLFAKLASPR